MVIADKSNSTLRSKIRATADKTVSFDVLGTEVELCQVGDGWCYLLLTGDDRNGQDNTFTFKFSYLNIMDIDMVKSLGHRLETKVFAFIDIVDGVACMLTSYVDINKGIVGIRPIIACGYVTFLDSMQEEIEELEEKKLSGFEEMEELLVTMEAHRNLANIASMVPLVVAEPEILESVARFPFIDNHFTGITFDGTYSSMGNFVAGNRILASENSLVDLLHLDRKVLNHRVWVDSAGNGKVQYDYLEIDSRDSTRILSKRCEIEQIRCVISSCTESNRNMRVKEF